MISTFHYKRQPEWRKVYGNLDKHMINTSQVCRIIINLEYFDQIVFVTIQFDAINNEDTQNTDRIFLQTTVPASDRTIESTFELICTSHLCTEYYFNMFIQNGLFDRLFTPYVSLILLQNVFKTLLFRSWFDTSSDEDEEYDQIEDYNENVLQCYEKDNDDIPMSCSDTLCSTYLSLDRQLFACGPQHLQYIPKIPVVQITIQITPNTLESPRLKMIYTCNKNKCNNRKKTTEIMNLIENHYNIAGWLEQFNIFSNGSTTDTSIIRTSERHTMNSTTYDLLANVTTWTSARITNHTPENIASNQHYYRLIVWMMICAFLY